MTMKLFILILIVNCFVNIIYLLFSKPTFHFTTNIKTDNVISYIIKIAYTVVFALAWLVIALEFAYIYDIGCGIKHLIWR